MKVTDAQEIKEMFSTVGRVTRVMGRNQERTSWNYIIEINFHTGVCLPECEMGLSEKKQKKNQKSKTNPRRPTLGTLRRRLEGKA